MEKLLKDIEFIVELDKMKSIERMTTLIGTNKREDDAQHSWHIAMMGMTLAEYADENIDVSKVIKMLLVHDIVEIYAGDTFAYDEKGYEDKLERELKSADRIFGILSEEKSLEFRKLWDEFEEMKTENALFANSMDRLQPILNNFYNEGGTWKKHGITHSKVLKRVEPIKASSTILYEYTLSLLDKAKSLGYIEED